MKVPGSVLRNIFRGRNLWLHKAGAGSLPFDKIYGLLDPRLKVEIKLADIRRAIAFVSDENKTSPVTLVKHENCPRHSKDPSAFVYS